jgi:VWFA-related protein
MRRRTLSAILVFIACALIIMSVGAPGFSQSPSQPPPKQDTSQSGTLRVTSRLVQVSVIVHDKDGKPVTGLTKEDFELFDQGQRQQIATFSEQKSILRATSADESPNLFTNRFAQGANAQPPLTVIVLDAFNTRHWDLYWCPPPFGFPRCATATMFHEVEKFINHMQPQDRVALYELTGNLYLLQDFTSDPGALLRGLDRGKEVSASFHLAGVQMDSIGMSSYTMAAMREIGNRLANVPGRKNLVWLSTGFPPAGIISDEKMDVTAKALANDDSPLSAIDALSLQGESGGGGAPVPGGGGRGGAISGVDLPTPALFGGNYGVRAMSGRTPRANDFDFTKELAELSGGRAFENTNDMAGAIRSAIDNSSTTYLLGYYPDHNKWKGEFRRLKVKVDLPGVKVRSRQGYYAVADTASAPEKDMERMADALHSPIEATDLVFDIQADAVDVPGARQLDVEVTLNPAQLRLEQQGDRWIDSVSELWVQFDGQGRRIATRSRTINLKPSLDYYKEFLQKDLVFSETLAVLDNAQEVRLVLHDRGNGAIGSVIIPLTKLFTPNSAPAPAKK